MFLFYVLWYGTGRAMVEGLRTDSLYIPGTGLRVSQVLAACSAVVALVVLLVNIKRPHKPMYVSMQAAGAGSADGDAQAAQDAAPAKEGEDVRDESANAETVSGSAGAEGGNAGGDERKD